MWTESVGICVSSSQTRAQLSYHTLPMLPAMADSTPLQDARLLSASLAGLLPSLAWPPGPPLVVVRDQPPSQARVELFSELDTQSLIVLEHKTV